MWGFGRYAIPDRVRGTDPWQCYQGLECEHTSVCCFWERRILFADIQSETLWHKTSQCDGRGMRKEAGMCTPSYDGCCKLTRCPKIYGVWGDTNGDDDIPLVGEASISLATACYGDSITGDNGHDETDVLYVAFTGDEAVPGTSADWKADNYHDFEASIQNLGDELIKRLS